MSQIICHNTQHYEEIFAIPSISIISLLATLYSRSTTNIYIARFFQALDINWTGMTNLLDIPGLR